MTVIEDKIENSNFYNHCGSYVCTYKLPQILRKLLNK